MKKLFAASIVLISLLSICGCSSSSESLLESAVTEETAPETAPTEEPTTKEPVVYDYVHGEEGYYNIADEMPEFEMKSQKFGTCWLHAAAASMETAYFKKNGSYISLEPLDLLDIIYINEKDEGFFINDGIDEKEVGGWQWMVTETLSKGFGDLTLESSVILDPEDREAIKENLRTRGGVAAEIVDMYPKKKAYFGKYYTVNYSMDTDYDHDVTIIGYDDHFPKDYFVEPAEEDGAWITYNSSLGSAGFYYISYCAPLGYAISHSATEKYGEVLSYDAGNEMDRCLDTGEWTSTANVFHKAGKLAAVGTYNVFDSQKIRIQIYDSSFTNVLYSQDAVLGYHGYHTIELDEPVDVTEFAVAVSYEKGAPVEGETLENSDGQYKTVSGSGESFVYIGDGETGWKDLTDSDISSVMGVDFEPNNCCIKAVFAK